MEEKQLPASSNWPEMAFEEAQKFLTQATTDAGETLASLAENPFLKFVTKVFDAKWLLAIFGEVDTNRVQQTVTKMQSKYPQEQPSQIARRLILNKAWEAGKVGITTNLLPPLAVALLAVDLAAVTRLQAEMVYEIAAAYNLDLQQPQRRGEVLAMFGLAWGGSGALKLGLSFAEALPGVGIVIGATTNMALLYTLGFAACRFYEDKLNKPREVLAASALQQESAEYLQAAIAQQRVMDRVLAHLVLASESQQSWPELVAQLTATQTQGTILEGIAAHFSPEGLEPLEQLLEKLDRDLALPLLARCQEIARLDGVVTAEEKKVLEAIATKFNFPEELESPHNSET